MLFKTVNKLLQKQRVQQYPSCFPDSTSLADAFNNFFISKIDKIHNAFTERAPENDLSSSPTTDRPLCDVQILNFQQVTLDMVKKFALKTLTKSCDLAQVKCQAGYRRDPGNPTQDPRWEWRDPALGGGIPPFPPGMKI